MDKEGAPRPADGLAVLLGLDAAGHLEVLLQELLEAEEDARPGPGRRPLAVRFLRLLHLAEGGDETHRVIVASESQVG
jgi:hypothetical protein